MPTRLLSELLLLIETVTYMVLKSASRHSVGHMSLPQIWNVYIFIHHTYMAKIVVSILVKIASIHATVQGMVEEGNSAWGF